MAVAKKKTASRRRPGKAPRRRRPAWFARLAFFARHALLWGGLAVIGYALWLDREVARSFETRQWSLPARVYARALELYPGVDVTRERLMRELEQLGYQRTGTPARRGQYAASVSHIEFRSRGHAFWDFPEPARGVRVGFADGAVASLHDLDAAEPIDLLRLEPLEIGTINPRRFEDRRLLRYTDLPQHFVAALTAVEDRRFFEHHGIDFFGLARAMASNLRAGRIIQGGSTLTQQLVKNFYLTRERTLRRKLTEMIMAVSLELRYAKQQILETYVNEVFLGQDGNRAIHGFGLAAQFYFGKPLAELDTASMALLIGMVKGPSAFDPRRNPQAALARRNVVLEVMAGQGLLDAAALDAARARPLRLRAGGEREQRANPAFMALVQRQLLRDYSAEDLKSAGLHIYTTLDPVLQAGVEGGVREALASIEQGARQRGLQAAMVVVDPATGEVLALIGDRDAAYAGFNRALDARRQVGSVIKPLVYACALAQPRRWTLASPLEDRAVSWTDPRGKVWQPKNFDGREYGRLSLLEALTRSLNLATVNLGLTLGLEQVRDCLRAYGVGPDLQAVPAILLGAVELSPYELATVYTALANDGFQVPLRAISDVTDQQQRKLNRYGLEVRAVMAPATAALARHAMTRVVTRGTARRLQHELPQAQPLAGKTGTSDDNRDSWFVGFGGNRLAVTWVGRDDNGVTGLTGSSGALRVWSAALRDSGLVPLDSTLPAELSWQYVDLTRAAVVPEHCVSAERIPVHQDSSLPIMTACIDGEPPAAAPVRRPGLLDRVRQWFE